LQTNSSYKGEHHANINKHQATQLGGLPCGPGEKQVKDSGSLGRTGEMPVLAVGLLVFGVGGSGFEGGYGLDSASDGGNGVISWTVGFAVAVDLTGSGLDGGDALGGREA
jgi:hypothetical protein